MKDLSIKEKLELLSDSAKYDVACTSSGVTRKGNGTGLGNSLACGICHSFSADGRCISLLKVLYTNHCIYDCKYCMNRASNDIPRTSFTPEELTNLTIQFYRRNYIEGLFLSSGIYPSPNKTMEQILQVVTLLRETHQFHGYIHIKAIPGTDPSLIDRIGWYVDRMSINMELPTANSLHQLAPHKSRSNILTPMRTIQQLRDHNRDYYGERLIASSESIHKLPSPLYNEVKEDKVFYKPTTMKVGQKRFVPAGQSTQFIIGASEDTDYEIIKTTEALYNKFDLKRDRKSVV